MAFGSESFGELIQSWDGKGVVVRYDAPTGAWMFIALHDDTLGRPVGGCRMRVYPRPEEGLRDAMRLAEGMTHKWAALDFPFGGGKAVLAVPEIPTGAARLGLLRRFGRLLNALAGAYGTGEDLGTTPDDMRELASVTDHVVGIAPDGEGPVDPGPFTALGVLEGIRAAVEQAFGDPSLEGRTVLVQGVGDVGTPLAQMVGAEHGRVILSDLDESRAFALAVQLGGSVVGPEDVYDTPCDVYAPCAVGATLNRETIPRLQCRIVAGSANNQLETPEDAGRLAERGILYAPDYVVNAGGAMAFGLISMGETDEEALADRVRGIGSALAEIFREADREDILPVEAARRRVQRTLDAARA